MTVTTRTPATNAEIEALWRKLRNEVVKELIQERVEELRGRS